MNTTFATAVGQNDRMLAKILWSGLLECSLEWAYTLFTTEGTGLARNVHYHVKMLVH